MADYKGVMAFCEVAGGKLTATALELLGGGKKLAADLGQELAAVIVGSGVAAVAPEAVAYGADKVYVVDDPALKDYQTDTYVTAMEKVVQQAPPQVLLLGQTAIGRDLAPRLGFRFNTAANLGCLDLAIDPASKRLLQTKPVYGGNAQAVFVCDSNPQIATIRAKVMTAPEKDAARKGEIVAVAAGIDPAAARTTVVEKVAEKVEGIRLEDARVIICGGRGIGSAEGFKELEALAALLKGAVGASRPPCDNGWLAGSLQIGLTGKIVAPELYIAVALSGSSQHMSGCSGAKTIVAINKDKEANIFREARFGVVGDWKKAVPALAAKLKELLAA